MTASAAPTDRGAFVQLIEFTSEHPERLRVVVEDWLADIGTGRSARWYVTAGDRDRPATYVHLVEFPDHASAMSNSDHPATAEFARRLRELCTAEPSFRNLDVIDARRM